MADGQRDSVDSKGAVSVDLEHLLSAHGDRLLRSAYLLCGNETEAQDLVQETFLQALKSKQRFRGDSVIYTWLHGILRNLSHRHRRNQKRLVFEEEVVLRQISNPASANEADDAFCAARLAQALQKLSAEHREVIVLRYYENLKIHQIAQQTGLSNGTVKSRLFYAVRALQQILPQEMNLFVPKGTYNQATK